MSPSLRGITEEPDFYRQIRQIVPDPMLRDDLLQATYFTLAHQPDSGTLIAHGIWTIAVDMPPIGKSIVIYYSFDARNVTLHLAFERAADHP